ncbi:hypothetical protein [Sphingobium estronivorans]|uniref:hypothetical protein n=1 Tax=Sphingobium estronivorans TaxID=1577690 RepID=UPI001239F17C|nr:hypothetical protein [Sphingobium estronivorans]
MKTPRTDMQIVTLLLHDAQGESWQLSLSADCLCFIGNYCRIEGFAVDAIIALDGLRKDG